jgi:hypothetical protein
MISISVDPWLIRSPDPRWFTRSPNLAHALTRSLAAGLESPEFGFNLVEGTGAFASLRPRRG